DASIVPGGDLAQEDVGQHFAAELEVVDAGNVEGRHIRAEHGWNEDQFDLGRGQLLVGGRHVRGAKIHRSGRDLADSAAGTDGLVVDLDAGVRLAVLAKPFG